METLEMHALATPSTACTELPAAELEVKQDAESRGTDSISVVLPCLNEAESIEACVREALVAIKATGLDGEVLVVDNGSTDGSGELAQTAGARVVNELRSGYGNALSSGIADALGSIIVMADADWTYDFQKLGVLVQPIRAGQADLVLGSRLDSATRQTMPLLHRYVGTPVLTHLVKRASGGLSVTDSQSGYRAFRKETAEQLGLKSGGMEFASEMLIKAGSTGLRVMDIPTGYRARVGESKLNTFADGYRHLRLIFMMAPDLLLLGPGLSLFSLGMILSLLGFIEPVGLEIGSVTWQPVFFSNIALVVGLQSTLIGTIFAHRSMLVGKQVRRRFRFVGGSEFPRVCVLGGVVALCTGLLVDGFLFLAWVHAIDHVSHTLALASAAQSLLIMGSSLVSAGFGMMWVRWEWRVPSDGSPSRAFSVN